MQHRESTWKIDKDNMLLCIAPGSFFLYVFACYTLVILLHSSVLSSLAEIHIYYTRVMFKYTYKLVPLSIVLRRKTIGFRVTFFLHYSLVKTWGWFAYSYKCIKFIFRNLILFWHKNCQCKYIFITFQEVKNILDYNNYL